MPDYEVQVTIQNRPGIADPEGETILNDLLRGRLPSVSRVGTAKVLRFSIREEDPARAEAAIRAVCEELRIFNPLVSGAEYVVRPAPDSN